MSDPADLIPAQDAACQIVAQNFHKIIGVIPGLGPLALQLLIDPVACIIAGTLGFMSGTNISGFILNILPTQTLKNIYVVGQISFFLIVNVLTKIPLVTILNLSPIVILVGGGISLIAILVSIIIGIIADFCSPPWK